MYKYFCYIVIFAITSLFACAQDNFTKLGSQAQSTNTNILTSKTTQDVGKVENEIINNDEKIYEKNKIKIGLLLPLSGKYASIGKSLFDAAQMAIFDLGDSNIVLLPEDTYGTATGAIKAADKMINKNVQLVLGPLLSEETNAIIAKLNQANINVVSFSNDQKLANSGAFLLGLIPEQQIERILSYSVANGVNNLSAIAPNNSLGIATNHELENFATSLKTNMVLFSQDNNGTIVNFDKQLDLALEPLINKESHNALLVSDSAIAINNLLTKLASNEQIQNKFTILSTGETLADAIAKTPINIRSLVAAPNLVNRKNFEVNFYNNFGYKPKNISTLAYDAVALSITIARTEHSDKFTVQNLTNRRGFFGIDGIFRLNENGLNERKFSIYEVNKDGFYEIDPAPSAFIN